MKTEKYVKIITSFARMYGVAETLKDLPFRNQEETYLLFSTWAKDNDSFNCELSLNIEEFPFLLIFAL